MSKSVCVMGHRTGIDRAAFQAYYETDHAPLATRYFPFTRYVRNHLMDEDNAEFDTISEFWADDIVATAALMQGPVGDILRADEETFMHRPAIAAAGAEEHILSPGRPGSERVATFIDGAGAADVAFRAAALDWAQRLAATMPAVSIDIVVPWGTPAFPAGAVLWTPASPGEPPAALAGTVCAMRVRRCETPAGQLIGNALST